MATRPIPGRRWTCQVCESTAWRAHVRLADGDRHYRIDAGVVALEAEAGVGRPEGTALWCAGCGRDAVYDQRLDLLDRLYEVD